MSQKMEVLPYEQIIITKTRSGWKFEHLGKDDASKRGIMAVKEDQAASFDDLVTKIKDRFEVD